MAPRDNVLDAFRAACARVDLAGRVAADLARDRGPVIVVAAGKCARAMFEGVLAARSADLVEALVVVPRGSSWVQGDERVRIMEATHPVPDETSVAAASAALALAGSARDAERVFLISGGASSLLCAPADGLGLERKQRVVRALLEADASIADVNVVRRHLSRIKGGGLARACGDHPRRTLVVSDVLSNDAHNPHDVGSGPTVGDPTTIDDAARVAARFHLGADLPWVETWKNDERFDVIADASQFAELVANWFRDLGFVARSWVDTIGHDVEQLAQRYAKIAPHMAAGDVLVQMAEPVLRVPSNAHGRGGRATHLAALMSSRLPANTLFAAIATDGVDGSSGTGGAVVDGPLEGAAESIARFDTGPLHVATRTALREEPTGLNFADLHVLLRY